MTDLIPFRVPERPAVPGPPAVVRINLYGALLADAGNPRTQRARAQDVADLARFLGLAEPGAAAELLVARHGGAGQRHRPGLRPAPDRPGAGGRHDQPPALDRAPPGEAGPAAGPDRLGRRRRGPAGRALPRHDGARGRRLAAAAGGRPGRRRRTQGAAGPGAACGCCTTTPCAAARSWRWTSRTSTWRGRGWRSSARARRERRWLTLNGPTVGGAARLAGGAGDGARAAVPQLRPGAQGDRRLTGRRPARGRPGAGAQGGPGPRGAAPRPAAPGDHAGAGADGREPPHGAAVLAGTRMPTRCRSTTTTARTWPGGSPSCWAGTPETAPAGRRN